MGDARTMHRVTTDRAPAAIGPYAQAVDCGDTVFCSGQIALDPATMALVPGDAAAQARRVLANLAAVLEGAGLTLAAVAKTTVYLADMGDFAVVNAVYAEAFGDHKPARATVEVARLPKDALVEIDCIAVRRRGAAG